MSNATEPVSFVLGVREEESLFVEINGRWPASLSDDVKLLKEELDVEDHDIEVAESSLFHGADFMTIFVAALALFLSGKRINENLDAWIDLCKRIRSAYNKISKRRSVFLSESAAAAFSFGEVIRSVGLVSEANLLSATTIQFDNQVVDEFKGAFRWNPERYYVFVWQTDKSNHVIGIKSIGTVLFHHQYLGRTFHDF